MSDQLIIKKPADNFFEPVEFIETTEANDPEPCLRIFCWSNPNGYKLQVRATAPIQKGRRPNRAIKSRNLIATIALTLEDLGAIAAYYETIKRQ